jgi:mannosyltransferase OCH1-like enzyme
MNYHYIKNKYDIVKYDFPDKFDVKIYYLNENYFQVDIQRNDSDSGWGLILEIKIYDLVDHEKYEIITIGKNDTKYKNDFYYTNIILENDKENTVLIPKNVISRKISLINNYYEVKKNIDEFIDYHIVIYYLNINKIKIIIRRLDKEIGWSNDLKIILFDKNKKNKELINIGNSDENYKYIIMDTKIDILFLNNDYYQDIPKIIFQTGYNNNFKNILHFNSIITFIELNPEYEYIYYSDYDSRVFLRDNFNDDINHAYYLLVPGAYKADLIRYCFLHYYGGCYFDCKQILRKPIQTFLKKETKILLCNDVIDKALLNAVIFSTSKNIIINKTIKDCTYNIINKLGTNALDITGPTFFYKSIKKYINSENVLLQNSRPPNDFVDFCKDYYNNNIKLISDNSIILNRFYNNYYDHYLNTNHYGKLYELKEIYYKNFQNINNNKIFIYPNKYHDKFSFDIINEKDSTILTIKRTDIAEGWNFNLKIIIIDNNLNEKILEIGSSKNNIKNITI